MIRWRNKNTERLYAGSIVDILLLVLSLNLIVSPAASEEKSLRQKLLPDIVIAAQSLVTEAEEVWACASSLPDDRRASARDLVREEWQRRRGHVAATLWATGFEAAAIAEVDRYLNPVFPDKATTFVACGDPFVVIDDWINPPPGNAITRIIASAGINWGMVVVDRPEIWQRLRAAIEPRLAYHSVTSQCIHMVQATDQKLVDLLKAQKGNWPTEASQFEIYLKSVGLPKPRVDDFLKSVIARSAMPSPKPTATFCADGMFSDEIDLGPDSAIRLRDLAEKVFENEP